MADFRAHDGGKAISGCGRRASGVGVRGLAMDGRRRLLQAWIVRLDSLPGHIVCVGLHRALPVAERLCRSWALYRTGRASVRDEVRDDDPVAFYVRARMLGMYRP
jgi:hypothetical protein